MSVRRPTLSKPLVAIPLFVSVATIACACDVVARAPTSGGRDAVYAPDAAVDAEVFDRARAAAPAIRLPLEVLGPAGYEVRIDVPVTDPEGIDALYLRGHRLAYASASTDVDGDGPKASVSLNGGPWVALDDDTVVCEPHEAGYGCLNGALATVRLRVPIEHFATRVGGVNELAFRFEGTDGLTIGYRVLDVDFLAGEERRARPGTFVEDDPNTWRAPRPSPADVEAGRALFASATLREGPGSDVTLRASCADCHAHDGRDLAYFNYSNWSIVARSAFHGLSQTEGEQIASYVRSLDLELPDGVTRRDLGRPWNPPFQPGPGLDARPAALWSAGAGIDAVLERDADSLPYLFPGGTSVSAMREVVDTDGELNMREMALAMQFPDWNEWLPRVHPIDIWGDAFVEHDVVRAYALSRERLGALRDAGASDEQVAEEAGHRSLRRFLMARTVFLSNDSGIGNRGTIPGNPPWVERPTMTSVTFGEITQELARLSLQQWGAVKAWELHREHDLERLAPLAHPHGEARGYLSDQTHVFGLAPHIGGATQQEYGWQSRLVGKYFSNAWYQLQVTVNPGFRLPEVNRPVDWPYQQRHIPELGAKGGPMMPVRYFASILKMWQMRDNGRGTTGRGWVMRAVAPWWLYSRASGDDAMVATLDEIRPGLRRDITEVFLREWLEVTTAYAYDEWARCPGGDWACLPLPDHEPRPYPGSGALFFFPGMDHASNLYRAIPVFRELGVSEPVLRALAAWGAEQWPLGDWASL